MSSRFTEEIIRLKGQKVTVEKRVGELESTIAGLQGRIEEAQGNVGEYQLQIDGMKMKNEELSALANLRTKELEDLKQEMKMQMAAVTAKHAVELRRYQRKEREAMNMGIGGGGTQFSGGNNGG
eukprot:PhF_6_TR15498/c0_g1_i1/m.24119